MDTGSDTGNFLGVGIYILFNEVVFVSEMEAGWYRYITQWRLGTNGTIRPRFGFAAVEHPCVCNVHHHHVYWRFDFDIRTAGNNRVREFNDPPLFGNQKWHTKSFEIRRPRDPDRARRWRVENTRTARATTSSRSSTMASRRPCPTRRSGAATSGSCGIAAARSMTAWWLSDRRTRRASTAGSTAKRSHDHDVVVWYGAHFTHDVSHHDAAQHGHILGPDLKPVNW